MIYCKIFTFKARLFLRTETFHMPDQFYQYEHPNRKTRRKKR